MAFDFLNIVIPVYNEGENIAKTLEEIERKLKYPHETHIIYDFDEDDTIPAVKKFIEERNARNVKLIKNKYGRGALNAIKTGFESFESGAVLVTMADLSDEIADANVMLEKMNEGYDLVCASRYSKGGAQIGGPKLKGALSRLAGLTLRYFAGIPTKDPTNSFKLYSKKLLNEIKIESDGGFELGLEIVVKAKSAGYKIAETPTIWRDRTAGKSKFKLLKWLPKYAKWYFFAFVRR